MKFFYVITALSLFTAIITFMGNIFNFSASDTANWVQAFGCILAILGGFLFINYERKKILNERNVERRKGVMNFCNLAKFIASSVSNNINLLGAIHSQSTTPPEVKFLGSVFALLPSLKYNFSVERKFTLQKQYQRGLNQFIELNAPPTILLSFTSLYEELLVIEKYINEISDIVNKQPPSLKAYTEVKRLLRKINHAKIMIDNYVIDIVSVLDKKNEP